MMEQDTKAEKFIVFEVAHTSYALPSRNIKQLEMVETITPVPNAAPCLEGVAFTRGQVIPALNLRSRFGLERVPHTPRSRLIVTSQNERTVGLVVDSAREFASIPAEAIQPPPHGLSGLSGNYLKGVATIGGRVILIVDLEELCQIETATATPQM